MSFDSLPYRHKTSYGSGCYRRRVRLEKRAEWVYGELEDDNHGFSVAVAVVEGRVREIQPEAKRIPYSTCPAAVNFLDNLLGADATLDDRELSRIAQPKSNCTHLLDLTLMCILHSQGDREVRVFDIEIADEKEGILDAKAWCDSRLIHHWGISKGEVVRPQALQGQTLWRGFIQWASEAFDGLERQAAFLLQKGHLVARGRSVDFDAAEGECPAEHKRMLGACYTYTPEIAKTAYRLSGTVRDFSDAPEQLLTFK